jgi:hypothetical protein
MHPQSHPLSTHARVHGYAQARVRAARTEGHTHTYPHTITRTHEATVSAKHVTHTTTYACTQATPQTDGTGTRTELPCEARQRAVLSLCNTHTGTQRHTDEHMRARACPHTNARARTYPLAPALCAHLLHRVVAADAAVLRDLILRQNRPVGGRALVDEAPAAQSQQRVPARWGRKPDVRGRPAGADGPASAREQRMRSSARTLAKGSVGPYRWAPRANMPGTPGTGRAHRPRLPAAQAPELLLPSLSA